MRWREWVWGLSLTVAVSLLTLWVLALAAGPARGLVRAAPGEPPRVVLEEGRVRAYRVQLGDLTCAVVVSDMAGWAKGVTSSVACR